MPFSSVRRPESVMVLLSLVMLAGAWLGLLAYRDADRYVNHTVEIRRQVLKLSWSVVNTQRGQRGYLITGKDTYLDPYLKGREEVTDRYTRLVGLTKDNTFQQDRLAAMRPNIEDLLDEMNWTVGQVNTGMKPDAYKMVDTGRGERAVRAIMADLDDITREEDRLLTERMRRETLLFRMVITACVVVGVLFGVVLVVLWSRVRVRPRPTVYLGPERRKSW